MKALLIALTAAVLAAVTMAGSTAALPPQPKPTCSPAPAECSAWHTSNVTVSWSAPSCPSTTVSSDTSGTPVSCTVTDGSGSVTTTINVRRDASPPSISASAERGPDANDWYSRGVAIRFSGSDGTSGISSCSSGNYSGPDTASGSVSGTCTNGAGLTRSTSFAIKYDGTAPTVAAKPERSPNSKGWYNRPVSVGFQGTDAVSGVDSCTAAVLYKGPDTAKTGLSGTCRDKAGNTSAPAAFELKYDTVPPGLKRVKVEIGGKGVALRWAASPDTVSYAIMRSPGLRGKKPSLIYTGPKRTFLDRRLENGVKYRYTVTAYDEAGNGAAKVIRALPRSVTAPILTPARPATPTLTRPAADARVTAAPLLAWTKMSKATYYNVQLWRNGVKILTVWPSDTRFRLQASWRYDGRRYTLTPGRYRWFVWPGFGLRSATNYGKLLGARTFLVVRN